MVSVVHNVKGARKLAQKNVLNVHGSGVLSTQQMHYSPFIHRAIATNPTKWKPALLFQEHAKGPTNRRAFGVGTGEGRRRTSARENSRPGGIMGNSFISFRTPSEHTGLYSPS
jgi:hypothetical protein